MGEEKKYEENHECFCKSKGFRNFLTVALGSFVGVYLALCLFTIMHRPPCPCMMGGYQMGFGYHNNFKSGCPLKHLKHHKDMDKVEVKDSKDIDD